MCFTAKAQRSNWLKLELSSCSKKLLQNGTFSKLTHETLCYFLLKNHQHLNEAFRKLVHHQSLSIFPMKSLIDSFYQKVLFACFQKLSKSLFLDFCKLARLRWPPANFLLNGAVTRPATITKTFTQTYPSYTQSFIKIGVLVLEKSGIKIMTLCNFNKDVSLLCKIDKLIVKAKTK